jgi:hypothetical protein
LAATLVLIANNSPFRNVLKIKACSPDGMADLHRYRWISTRMRSPFIRFWSTMLSMALKLYLVTCNLFQSGDYRSLKERFRTLDAKQVLDNQWALRSTYSAGELKEIFRQLMDDRDRIVVTEVGAEWASRRALVNMAKL